MTTTAMIKEAQAQIRKLKRAVPHLFPEYNNLLVAESEYKQARFRLDAARRKWKELGQSK